MTDDDRITTKTVRLTEPTHSRLKDHCREGETLSGAVDRALDALERQENVLREVQDELSRLETAVNEREQFNEHTREYRFICEDCDESQFYENKSVAKAEFESHRGDGCSDVMVVVR